MLSRCYGYRQLLRMSATTISVLAVPCCLRGSPELIPGTKGTTSLTPSGLEQFLAALTREEAPDRLVFINGAPGSGKTAALNTARAFSQVQIAHSMSSLLAMYRKGNTSGLKATAGLVGDEAVCSALLQAIKSTTPLCSRRELILDGFPRSDAQVTFLEQLVCHVNMLRSQQERPALDLCMVVLHVDEATSIKRQQARQLEAEQHNAEVRRTGEGTLIEERITDQSTDLCRERYAVFARSMPALARVQSLMPVYNIDASGPADNCSHDVASVLIQHRELNSSPRSEASAASGPVSPWWSNWPKWFGGEQMEAYGRKQKGVVLNRGGWAPHGVVWA